MTVDPDILLDLAAANGPLAKDCVSRLCASGLLGTDAPEVDALLADGRLLPVSRDGADHLSARGDRCPDIDRLGDLHDRAVLALLDGNTVQGHLARRMDAHAVRLDARRLELLRRAGKVDNPRIGIWRTADKPPESHKETHEPAAIDRILDLLRASDGLALIDIREMLDDLNANTIRMSLRRLRARGLVDLRDKEWIALAEPASLDPPERPPFALRIENLLIERPGIWTLRDLRKAVSRNVDKARYEEALAPLVAKGLVVRRNDTWRTVHGEEERLERIALYSGVPTELLIAVAAIWETDLDAPTGISPNRKLSDAGYAVEAPRLRTAIAWLREESVWDNCASRAEEILARSGIPIVRRHDKRRRIGNTGRIAD